MRAYKLCAVAVLAAMSCGPAVATVVPSPGGAQAQALPGGAEVVDIAAPNAAGVSLNHYQRFDVDPPGAVLNNAAQPSPSRIAGMLPGNAQSGFAPAALIINEVGGAIPSALRGPLEVAGPRADVVVANPAGIVCDGCGFINAGRVALSTGRAMIDAAGALHALLIEEGHVGIGPLGLVADAASLGRLEVLARSMSVNGHVNVPNLQAVAGVNRVQWSNLAATTRLPDGVAPLFAIDIAQGVHAGSIKLVATERGVGVRSHADLVASNGDLYIQGQGDVAVPDASRRLVASGYVGVASHYAVNIESPVSAGQYFEVAAGGDLQIQEEVSVGGHVTLLGEALSVRGATLRAGGTASLVARHGLLDATGSTMHCGGKIDAHALGDILAGGAHWSGGDDVALSASNVRTNNHAAIHAQRGLRITADAEVDIRNGTLRGDTIAIGGETLLTRGGTIEARVPPTLPKSIAP